MKLWVPNIMNIASITYHSGNMLYEIQALYSFKMAMHMKFSNLGTFGEIGSCGHRVPTWDFWCISNMTSPKNNSSGMYLQGLYIHHFSYILVLIQSLNIYFTCHREAYIFVSNSRATKTTLWADIMDIIRYMWKRSLSKFHCSVYHDSITLGY